jgi:hypothetical protein
VLQAGRSIRTLGTLVSKSPDFLVINVIRDLATMLEQVEAAIQRHDYQTAGNILTKLAQAEPDSNKIKLYNGKLQEATDQLDSAERTYRQLLQGDLVDPKIQQAARQGIQRVQALQTEQIEAERDAALQYLEASSDLAASLPKSGIFNYIEEVIPEDVRAAGLLILEPVESEEKASMAYKLAQIMKIETYNARLLLPSRSSRVYRTGNMAEMNFYERQLRAASIPAFALSIEQLNQPEIVQVKSIDSFSPKAKITAINSYGTEFSRSYEWQDIQGIVSGLLPIFEEITQTNVTTTKTKVQYKDKILDYVQIWDLHIPSKKTILRICSQSYVFQPTAGASSPTINKLSTSRENWQKLIDRIREQTPQTRHWKEFTPFAATALEYPDLLQKITAHLQLVRREASLWDPAFQLYSGAIFARHKVNKFSINSDLN